MILASGAKLNKAREDQALFRLFWQFFLSLGKTGMFGGVLGVVSVFIHGQSLWLEDSSLALSRRGVVDGFLCLPSHS